MTETCVRIYDDVVSKEMCNETIDMFEKIKKGFDPKNPDKAPDPRFESIDFNQVTSQRKSFTEICLEGKDEWSEIKKLFLLLVNNTLLNLQKT